MSAPLARRIRAAGAAFGPQLVTPMADYFRDRTRGIWPARAGGGTARTVVIRRHDDGTCDVTPAHIVGEHYVELRGSIGREHGVRRP